MGESQRTTTCLDFLELSALPVALDLQVISRRTQVLPDGRTVDADAAKSAQYQGHLVDGLAETHHQSGLDDRIRPQTLRLGEHCERALEVRPRPHATVESRHGLDVVVVDVRLRPTDGGDGSEIATKVRGQHLHGRFGASLADCENGSRELVRAAVGKLVPADGGQHHMGER